MVTSMSEAEYMALALDTKTMDLVNDMPSKNLMCWLPILLCFATTSGRHRHHLQSQNRLPIQKYPYRISFGV
jgi:hypothetical protein